MIAPPYVAFFNTPTVTCEPTPACETHAACLAFGTCRLIQSSGFVLPNDSQMRGSPWNLSYFCCSCQRHSTPEKMPVAPTACMVPIKPPERLAGHFPPK